MKTIQTKLRTGPDGEVSLNVSSGMPDMDLDVTIIMQPAGSNVSGSVRDPEDWKRFIAETSGSIQDPTFERHEQGSYEQRDSWS